MPTAGAAQGEQRGLRKASGGGCARPSGGGRARRAAGPRKASGGAALVALQLSYVDLRVVQLQVGGVGFVIGVLGAGCHAR